MSNQPTQPRVLGRTRARLLSDEELQQISGGFHTTVCSFDPITCIADGDCIVPPACG